MAPAYHLKSDFAMIGKSGEGFEFLPASPPESFVVCWLSSYFLAATFSWKT